MKQIQPLEIWKKGIIKTAEFLDVRGTETTLGVEAKFIWHLYAKNDDDSVGELIDSDNLTMSGEDYQEWLNDSFAWQWVASQLNIIIL